MREATAAFFALYVPLAIAEPPLSRTSVHARKMDFSVGRLAYKPGTISKRRTVEVSDHEAVPFLLVDFPEPAEVGRELASSLSSDDFGVKGKDVSTAPGGNPHSRWQGIGSLDIGTTQLGPDEWDALESAYGNGTELSGSTTSLESGIEHYHQVYGRSFPSLKYGLSW